MGVDGATCRCRGNDLAPLLADSQGSNPFAKTAGGVARGVDGEVRASRLAEALSWIPEAAVVGVARLAIAVLHGATLHTLIAVPFA